RQGDGRRALPTLGARVGGAATAARHVGHRLPWLPLLLQRGAGRGPLQRPGGPRDRARRRPPLGEDLQPERRLLPAGRRRRGGRRRRPGGGLGAHRAGRRAPRVCRAGRERARPAAARRRPRAAARRVLRPRQRPRPPVRGARRPRAAADGTVRVLVDGYLDTRGILDRGCYSKRNNVATRNELIWASYYLFEALCVLTGKLDAAKI